MKRLRVGPLLERLIENMMMNETSLSEFDRARSGQKKMYFFSGHDATMAGLLNTLGIFNKKRPTFTSAIMIELHRKTGSSSLHPDDKFIEVGSVCHWIENLIKSFVTRFYEIELSCEAENSGILSNFI